MSKAIFTSLLISILLINPFCASAQKTIQLNHSTTKIELTKEQFAIFEDKTGQLSFEEIQKQKFYKNSNNSANFGYSESKYWIKCHIQNQTDKKWLFAMMASLVDEFEFYEVLPDGSVKKRVSGDKYPHSEREEDLPIFGFNFFIPKNHTHTFYLSVKSIDTKQFTLQIEEEIYLIKNQHTRINLWFFYFGLLSMMVVYNLLLYFSIYDKSYLFYVLYILSFIFAQLTLLGFGNQLIWGNYVWFNNRTPVFFTSTTGIFALLFAYNFLNVNQFYPKLKWIFRGLNLLNLILAILTIIEPNVLYNRLSSYLIIVQVVSVVIIGILIMRKGYPPARYYMLSWAILFLALILFALKMSGFLPLTKINYTLLPIGAAIEVVMLSLGLGNRINTAQKEKTEAQKELVNQLLENEQVRGKIARDLHDDLGSTLSSIRILSEFAKNQINDNPKQAEDLLKKIVNSSQKLQESLQDIVWTTQSKENTLNELTTRMRRFGGEILEAKSIDFYIKIDENLNKIRFASNIQYDIFMIFKEAINNIVKYAEATNVNVIFGLDSERIILSIVDDGKGFDVKIEKEGNGLKNMNRRTGNLDGNLELNSIIGQGTSIILNFPVPQ